MGDPQSGVPGLRPTGLYASYRGRTYPVVSYAGGGYRTAVLRIREDEVRAFGPMVHRRPPSPEGPVAFVPLHELDALIDVSLRARYAGREVSVMAIGDHTVEIYANAPPAWGKEHRLRGSQYDGYRGTVSRNDVEILGEEVADILAALLRRPSRNL